MKDLENLLKEIDEIIKEHRKDIEHKQNSLKELRDQKKEIAEVIKKNKKKTKKRKTKAEKVYTEELKNTKFKNLIDVVKALGGCIFVENLAELSYKSKSQTYRDIQEATELGILEKIAGIGDKKVIKLADNKTLSQSTINTILVKNLYNFKIARTLDLGFNLILNDDIEELMEKIQELEIIINERTFSINIHKYIIKEIKILRDVRNEKSEEGACYDAQGFIDVVRAYRLTFDEYKYLLKLKNANSENIDIKEINRKIGDETACRTKADLKILREKYIKNLLKSNMRMKNMPRGKKALEVTNGLKKIIEDHAKERTIELEEVTNLKAQLKKKEFDNTYKLSPLYKYRESARIILEELQVKCDIMQQVNLVDYIESKEDNKQKYTKPKSIAELEQNNVFITNINFIDEKVPMFKDKNCRVDVSIIDYSLNLKDFIIYNIFRGVDFFFNEHLTISGTRFTFNFTIYCFDYNMEIKYKKIIDRLLEQVEIYHNEGKDRRLAGTRTKKDTEKLVEIAKNGSIELINLELDQFFVIRGDTFYPSLESDYKNAIEYVERGSWSETDSK